MSDIVDQTPAQLLIKEMGITEETVARRRRIVGLDEADLGRIASVKEIVQGQLDALTAIFFDHLASIEEGRPVTGSPASLQRSTQASVWPERMSTPPSRAISGKT